MDSVSVRHSHREGVGKLSRKHIQMCWSRSSWGPEDKQVGAVVEGCLLTPRWLVLNLRLKFGELG